MKKRCTQNGSNISASAKLGLAFDRIVPAVAEFAVESSSSALSRGRPALGLGLALAGVFAAGRSARAAGAAQYFADDGSALTTTKWGTSTAGPFTSAFTSGNIAHFDVAGTGTGLTGTITVAGIVATQNLTLPLSGSGTLSAASSSNIDVNVSSGITLDLGNENFSSTASVGYTKDGDGILAAMGNTYQGGFTLNAGTIITRSVNAMGGGASNSLTINGGIIASNLTRNFTGKFGLGITIGGNFQLGALQANSALAFDTANFTFSDTMAIGATTRTITLGNKGTQTLNGVISGTGSAGLTVQALTGTTGATMVLGAANTYAGATNISGGIVRVNNTTGSGTGAAAVTVGSGGTVGGTGFISGAVTLNSGATVTAGADTTHVGTLTTGDQAWNSGGAYLWKIADNQTTPSASGAPGTNWDSISMGALTVPTSPTSQFTVDVETLGKVPIGTTTSITPGAAVSNFSSGTYVIASLTSTNIPGVVSGSTTPLVLTGSGASAADSAAFALDTTAFGNETAAASNGDGYLEFIGSGTGTAGTLDFVYNSSPEPGSAMLFLAGMGPMLLSRRRKRGLDKLVE